MAVEPATPNAEDSMEGWVGPGRQRLPTDRHGTTRAFTITDETLGRQKGYLTLNRREDGTLGEMFLRGLGKQGSMVDGMVQWAMVLWSIGMQFGVEIPMLCRKLAHMKFEPHGVTNDPDIPYCHSIPAYIAERVARDFCDDDVVAELVQVRERMAAP